MSLITIKPVPSKRWHGKTGAESFGQSKTIEVLYSHETGGYATGLTVEETEKYSKKLGVDLSSIFHTDEPHPYWSTKAAWIDLPNATKIFNTQKDSDFVKVKNLKASKFVANSLSEYEEGLWPEATHIIYDEEEEMEIKATRSQKLQKAYGLLAKMTSDDKVNIVQIISNKNLKGRSTNFIDAEISNIIDNDGKDTSVKTGNIEDFFRYVEMGREKIALLARVYELLLKNILTKQGTNINYMGDVIGTDIDDVVRYFEDPNNVNVKVAILDKLNKK